MASRFIAIAGSLATIGALSFGICRTIFPAVKSAPPPSPQSGGDSALTETLYSEDAETEAARPYQEPYPDTEPAADDVPEAMSPADSGNAPPAPPPGRDEVLEALTRLSDTPLWLQWVAQSAPLTRLLQTMDAIACGQRPAAPLDFLLPQQPFSASCNTGGECTVSPAAIRRFQPAIALLCAIPPQKIAGWYLLAEPVLQDEYRCLGSRSPLRQLLLDFCNAVLSIPDFDFEPALVRISDTLYRYEDPAFEGLTDGQKLLVRTGYRNCALLKRQCRAVADAIGLYASSAPQPGQD